MNRLDSKSLSLFLLSSLIIIIAYSFPSLYLLSLVGYALLIYALIFVPPSLVATALWAALFFLFHLYPIALIALTHGTASSYAFLLLLSVYLIILTSIILYAVQRVIKRAPSNAMKALVAIIVLYYLIVIMDTAIFFPLGVIEGYGALQPLTPLMHSDCIAGIIFYYGLPMSTLIFLFLASLLAFLYRYHSLLFLVLSLSLLIVSFFEPRSKQYLPATRASACSFNPHHVQPWDSAYAVYRAVEEIISSDPCVKTIIFPESTCPFPLNNYPEIIAFLSQAFPEQTIILGAHRLVSNQLYNSLYILKNNSLSTHDKAHGLVGAERAVPFFSKKSLITSGSLFSQPSSSSTITIDSQKFTPLICSELFFKTKAPEHQILCIANDAWYCHTFLPHTLANVALLKAAAWKQPIMYVAHNHSFYFSASAGRCTL